MTAALDFAMFPPEVNSARMYSGAGSGPMVAAASAWKGLAAELRSTALSYGSVLTALTDEEWHGPASAAMAAAALPYVAWMNTTAAQAEQTADAGRGCRGGLSRPRLPPRCRQPAIAANRAQLAPLVATNVLGQNTPAIAVTEAQYAEMWAQDAAAMYGYAGSSAAASQLTAFTQPEQIANADRTDGPGRDCHCRLPPPRPVPDRARCRSCCRRYPASCKVWLPRPRPRADWAASSTGSTFSRRGQARRASGCPACSIWCPDRTIRRWDSS